MKKLAPGHYQNQEGTRQVRKTDCGMWDVFCVAPDPWSETGGTKWEWGSRWATKADAVAAIKKG